MLPPDFESNASYNRSATLPPHAVSSRCLLTLPPHAASSRCLLKILLEVAVVAASNGPFYFSFKAELSLLERTK